MAYNHRWLWISMYFWWNCKVDHNWRPVGRNTDCRDYF